MMIAWDFPVFIVAAVLAATVVGWWLIRLGYPVDRAPDFQCAVCGRKQNGLYPRQWRYCPFCGAARDATSLRDLPRRR